LEFLQILQALGDIQLPPGGGQKRAVCAVKIDLCQKRRIKAHESNSRTDAVPDAQR
jgi:hypothetical protein